MYINDRDRLASPMGQFQLWEGKLFYYSGERLGWRYLRG
jgi:hypothetical protein